MKSGSGSFLSVEDVMDALEKIHLKLDSLGQARSILDDSGYGEVVWAIQTTIVELYDMLKSNMCQLLMAGTTNHNIRTCQPNGSMRRYNVADVDAYILDISVWNERNLGGRNERAGSLQDVIFVLETEKSVQRERGCCTVSCIWGVTI